MMPTTASASVSSIIGQVIELTSCRRSLSWWS